MNDRDETEGSSGRKACLRCGKLVSPDDVFCTSCGWDLRTSPLTGQAGAVDPADFQASRREYAPSAGQAYPAAGTPLPTNYAGYYSQPPPAYPGYPTAGQGAPIPYYPPGYVAKKTDEMAIISLICGLGSFIVFPFFPAIAAIVLGFMSRDRIVKAHGNLEGEWLAVAGIVLGILNLVLSVVVVVTIVMIAYSQACAAAMPLC